jgi:hypothetical protein
MYDRFDVQSRFSRYNEIYMKFQNTAVEVPNITGPQRRAPATPAPADLDSTGLKRI